MGNEVSSAVNYIPVVGQIKAGIHAACGDSDQARKAVEASSVGSWTTAGTLFGVVAGGPAGAIGGAVAGHTLNQKLNGK
ncbi:unnamed protein product, partial [Mesorhabditis belari]|uniref:Glycine zipper 2TM domain-containing protein n=1 Tax=Mesorhabditis belari TaxID=2138241 RepID=A0AAF3ENH8_9BILA